MVNLQKPSERKFQISDGFVDIVGIYHADEMQRRPERVTRRQIAHFFGTRQSGGRSKRAPLRGKFNGFGGSQQCHFRFEISDKFKRLKLHFRPPSLVSLLNRD